MSALEQPSNPRTRRAASIGYHRAATDTEYHMILAAMIPGRRLLAGAVCTLLATVGVTAAAAELAGTASTQATSAAEQNVLRATLPNGLRVIIVRNTLAPVVATS